MGRDKKKRLILNQIKIEIYKNSSKCELSQKPTSGDLLFERFWDRENKRVQQKRENELANIEKREREREKKEGNNCSNGLQRLLFPFLSLCLSVTFLRLLRIDCRKSDYSFADRICGNEEREMLLLLSAYYI